MFGKDWLDLGDRLNDVIENAVGKGNFGHLSDSISDVMKSIDRLWDKARWPGSESSSPQGAPDGYDEDVYNDEVAAVSRDPERYFASGTRRRGGAIGRIAGGVVLLALGAAFLLVSGVLVMMEVGWWVWVFPAAMLLLGAVVTGQGIGRLSLSKSFDLYVRVLRGKLFIDIKTLAAYAHKTEGLVLKELRRMMAHGWFPQGHLDHAGSCLMVSDQVYEQYLATMENVRQQAATAQRQEETSSGKDSLSPEAQAVMKKGQEYIERIRACNDKIPGEEASRKIYRMEQLVQKIFQQARLHPENIPDLRKFMEYYLPMSIKLLTAYEELDSQPVQGENITGSKLEIMKALDTLNVAFEKLLESLFQDTVMDVSTDISVLQTLLAQDGLTDSGFPKK